MRAIEGGPGSGRYIVSSVDTGKLSQFIQSSYQDPGLQLIDTLGPIGAPHTAVYDMAHAKAAELQRRFTQSGDLKIEPDQPLSMFGIS
ncbi:MAG: hypothetical protein RL001_1591 [Pseudomonadota bacterium]|nr:hypothetical protein [Oxalobacteraceae bacterium]